MIRLQSQSWLSKISDSLSIARRHDNTLPIAARMRLTSFRFGRRVRVSTAATKVASGRRSVERPQRHHRVLQIFCFAGWLAIAQLISLIKLKVADQQFVDRHNGESGVAASLGILASV